jgi:hypothetical protein
MFNLKNVIQKIGSKDAKAESLLRKEATIGTTHLYSPFIICHLKNSNEQFIGIQAYHLIVEMCKEL